MKLIILFLFFLDLLPTFASPTTIKMAVTVDDLPRHGNLPPGMSRLEIAKSMLATLKSNHVPEVYGFINGGKIGKNRELTEILNLWTKSGYPLGNHTFSHKDLHKISAQDFEKEIASNEVFLKTIGDNFDWHYFRYPFLHEGDTFEKRSAVRTYLKANKYKIAFVTDEFEDWAWNDPYERCKTKNNQKSVLSLKESYAKAASDRFLRDGEILNALYHRPVARILLIHIGAFDAQMLLVILKMYKENGVEFIPLSEAIKDPIYEEDLGTARGGGGDFEYNALKARGLTEIGLGLGPSWEFPGKQLSQVCSD